MDNIDLRPRYSMIVPITIEESINRIVKGVELSNGDVNVIVRHHNIKLSIAEEDQHYWSPELNINIDHANVDGETVVYGVCGPKQSVWLMFTFFYGLLIFATLVVSLFGFTRLNLGMSSEILFVIPVLLIIIISMYFTSKYGQKLAYDQMYLLRKIVKRAIVDNNVDLKLSK